MILLLFWEMILCTRDLFFFLFKEKVSAIFRSTIQKYCIPSVTIEKLDGKIQRMEDAL